MQENQKLSKNAPLMVGVVLIAMVTIFGFIADIPFAMKEDVEKQLEEIKEKQKLLEALKNTDNQWYRELSEDVAVVSTKMEGMDKTMGKFEKKLDTIEGLLRNSR